MGFKNEQRGGARYINFKKGKMINDGKEQGSFEGELVELEIKPEVYEGKPYQQLVLFFWEPALERIFEVQMSMTSGYGFAFFAMTPNIDPGVPLEISCGMNTLDNGNKAGALFLRQQEKPLKWYYSKKNNPEAFAKIPAAKEIKKATKNKPAVFDYEDRDNFIEKVLTAFQTKKLLPLYPKGASGFKSKSSGKEDAKGRSIPSDVTEDDLPF